MTRVRHEVVGADVVVIAPASSRHPCGPCSPRWGTRRRRRRETPRRMVRPTVGRRRGVTPSTVDREQRSIAYLWKRSGETCFYTTIFPCTVRPPSPSSVDRPSFVAVVNSFCCATPLWPPLSPSWAFDVKSSATRAGRQTQAPKFTAPICSVSLERSWFCSVIFHALG